ncbi:MAG: cysteine-rich CWC family protein [Bacteroidales bacterium]|nr:cysteine-rich CWC family protein [Bacteroidales bacterium]
MKKLCPRCGCTFECNHDDIRRCACAGVPVDAALRLFLQESYGERCLCADCLKKLAAEKGKKA